MKSSGLPLLVVAACLQCSATQLDAPDAGADAGLVCADIGRPSVVPNDELGYPPYSMEGCRVAYIDSQSGALVVQSLGSTQSTLEAAANQPRRPAVASDVIAWEATLGAQPVVRLLYGQTITTMPVPSGYDHVSEPAVATALVVVTAWLGSLPSADTDVLAFDPRSGSFTPIATGPKQQRFAAASDALIAVTDFTEDPSGFYTGTGNDLADIGVFTRSTAAYVIRSHPGKDAFPAIMNNDVLGYLHWGDVHPEPKLEAYSVYLAYVAAAPSTDTNLANVTNAVQFIRPSATAGVLEWVTSVDTGSALWRYGLGQGTAPTALSFQGTLLGSVTVDRGTLLAQNSVLTIVGR